MTLQYRLSDFGTEYYAMPNIVAQRRVVPELLQEQCTPQNIADRALKVLEDPREIERVKYQLSRVKEKMGGPGASLRVAETILRLIQTEGSDTNQSVQDHHG